MPAESGVGRHHRLGPGEVVGGGLARPVGLGGDPAPGVVGGAGPRRVTHHPGRHPPPGPVVAVLAHDGGLGPGPVGVGGRLRAQRPGLVDGLGGTGAGVVGRLGGPEVGVGDLSGGPLGQAAGAAAEIAGAGRLVGGGRAQGRPGRVDHGSRGQPQVGGGVLGGHLLGVGIDAGGGQAVAGGQVGAGHRHEGTAPGRGPLQLERGRAGVVVVLHPDPVAGPGGGVGEGAGGAEA